MSALSVTRQLFWSPPQVERALPTIVAAVVPHFLEGQHYRMVTRESGSDRHDLPIWTTLPGAVTFDTDGWGPVERSNCELVPGAFVLSNVLTGAECDAISTLSEAMGYTEDAPVSLGRRIRKNENCVIVADDTLWKPIWERVAAHMPAGGSTPLGLNQRWRLYKYHEEDVFRMHTDGSWPGSGVDPNRPGAVVRDIFGDRWSQMTFLIYLDGDYDGGETTFFVPHNRQAQPGTGELVSIAVPKGSVLCFFHGEHPMSPLHEGSLVTKGLKRIVRSDVLYSLDGGDACDAPSQ